MSSGSLAFRNRDRDSNFSDMVSFGLIVLIVTVRLLPAIATEGMTYDDRDSLVNRLTIIAEKEIG